VSILFCTPCYGGKVDAPFFRSCIDLRGALVEGGIEHDFLIGWNESLIQRARNTQVATFLRDTNFRKLMFLDADIEFSPESVAKLWNLDVDVAVGCYPMKRPDMPLSAWRDGKLVNFTDWPAEPFEVDYAGTGFFMVDRSVFERMAEAYPERAHMEGYAMQPRESFAWFDPRVEDGVYLSEDFAFCKDWRALGGKVIADPSIRLRHWGNIAYGEQI
jgi:hypothetical protein